MVNAVDQARAIGRRRVDDDEVRCKLLTKIRRGSCEVPEFQPANFWRAIGSWEGFKFSTPGELLH